MSEPLESVGAKKMAALEIGHAGGQQFDVARAIRTFLQQMAEGNIDRGAAVIKELLQNADDAEATEVNVILDERSASPVDRRLTSIQVPSLIVHNDKAFSDDNFKALREVGSGHKLSNPTAAGRFGIGFNSVYFLTDTPLLFSQREVHLFDLLHSVVDENGWIFSLDDFRQGKGAGPIKAALEWVFPKITLRAGRSFGELAHSGANYSQTLLRLPLRQWDGESGTPLFKNNYVKEASRRQMLESMWTQSLRCLLFLKFVRRLTFAILVDSGLEDWGKAEITEPPAEFRSFLANVEEAAKRTSSASLSCDFFERTISYKREHEANAKRSFFVKHVAPFGVREIAECRERLRRNGERAVPWAAIAVPKDLDSLRFDSPPSWRVFLPVNEPAPSACILHAALFVGPSRQRIEYRSNESDETQRKTRWNQLLAEHGLVPLLRDADFNQLAPTLLSRSPKEAMTLIPEAPDESVEENLGEYVKQVFHREPWLLRLRDIWTDEFELLVNDPQEESIVLEMIPEWLTEYKDRFGVLQSGRRSFVSWTLGEAVRERLKTTKGITVQREIQEDVLRCVLAAEEPPSADHLKRLLEGLPDVTFTADSLEDLWALQEPIGDLIRFASSELYLVPGPPEARAIHEALRRLNLDFEGVHWVELGIGLPAVKRPWIDNLKKADARAALELLTRVASGNRHDQLSSPHALIPAADFLCSQDPSWLPKNLRLGFMVKTAVNQHASRSSGTIFLRSENPSEEEETLWKGLLRGAFPEIDPSFAPNLRRLLRHAPGLQESISVPESRVEFVNATAALSSLHRGRVEDPDCFRRIGEALRKRLNGGSASRDLAFRAARSLVEEADRVWDSLEDDRKATILALPIHRTASGDLLALSENDGVDVATLSANFWLQSDEDLHDAPIRLPDRQILHSEDPRLNHFYRNRLGIRPKDRVALLRECLRQIGSDDIDNPSLLKYIAACFRETVETLKNSSVGTHPEADELEGLLQESKSVPCIDRGWRRSSECTSAWELARILRGQGWALSQLEELVAKLVYPQPIVTLDSKLGRMVRELHNIDEVSSQDVAQLAASSESGTFNLQERAKIIGDNLRPRPSGLQRAQAIEGFLCPSLDGETEFRSLVLLPHGQPVFRSTLIKCPFPEAADLTALSRNWGLDEASVGAILIYLSVPSLTISQIIQAAVKATTAVQPEQRLPAWEALTQWMGKIAVSHAVEVVGALRNQPWVLAKKGGSLEFCKASDVLYRSEAGDILDKHFWVIAAGLPAGLASLRSKLDFPDDVASDAQTLERLAHCLAESHSTSNSASLDVYRLIARLLRKADTAAKATWLEAASTFPVFRLFRTPEVWLSSERLYRGNDALRREFGDLLRCLSTIGNFAPEVWELYKDLGISEVPTLGQVIAALSRIEGVRAVQRPVHEALVSQFEKLLDFEPEPCIAVNEAKSLRVLTYGDAYVALSNCYSYPAATKAVHLEVPSRGLVIDEGDTPTKRLLARLETAVPGAVAALIDEGTARPVEIVDASPSEQSTLTLAPWEQWLEELADRDSEVRQKVAAHLVDDPVSTPKLLVASKLRINYELPNGKMVMQAAKWEGPASFGDSSGRILVLKNLLDQDHAVNPKGLEDLDRNIAKEIGRFISQDRAGEISNVALETLERPRVVFDKLRGRARDSLLHQYNDQNADAEFAVLLDEYLRTVKGTDKKNRLEKQLFEHVYKKFVPARREQIRAYGYDHFSVFTELLQNAEDAYLQSDILGLPRPDPAYIRFKFFQEESGNSILRVEHAGRPFNHYRHGARKEETYKKDVEGVLRSAGSFKPQAQLQHAESRTLGKFGLGFKSVLLLTDRPRIHSGQWHFEIQAGCIPNQIARPIDLASELTRIDLPLLSGDEVAGANLSERLPGLMPFLRQISQVELTEHGKPTLQLRSSFVPLSPKGAPLLIERVTIGRSDGGQAELLRVRDSVHQGQLAMYLDAEGLPASWDQMFEWDTFAGLPLRLHLGVGVGVSHQFKIQAGRTHLIALDENGVLFGELAGLMAGLSSALESCISKRNRRADVFQRFWAVWSWDTGDQDGAGLRAVLAQQLLAVAEKSSIVPTRDPDSCASLRDGPLICFHGLPDAFATELLREAVEVCEDSQPIVLRPNRVITHGTHSALQQAARAAHIDVPGALRIIGWAELGGVFEARPWLAERPALFSVMARSLLEEDRNKVLGWLGRCKFRAADGTTHVPFELLPQTFPGAEHLLSHRMHQIDPQYDPQAIELLKSAGMPSKPTAQALAKWITDGMSRDECVAFLRYLAEDNRWREYYELRRYLMTPWFATGTKRLTTADALAQNLVPFELDTVFMAWLGSNFSEPEVDEHPSVAPEAVLRSIQEWWRGCRQEAVKDYEQRTYPDEAPPQLYLDGVDLQHDRAVRGNWLILLILGCLHTLGRTMPEQHKTFLQRCLDRGWLDVFADPDSSAARWIGILEDYCNQIEDESYRPWVLQFVSIYVLSRHLQDYVLSFVGIEQQSNVIALDLITRPRTNPLYQGGGPDAPPAGRMLGIGACFVVRELARLKILRSPFAHPHCYVPHQRVRLLFSRLGWENTEGPGASASIHKFLVHHLGSEGATFEYCFDLPFQRIAEDPELQERFFGGPVLG